MNRVTQRLLSAVLLLSWPAAEGAKRKLPTDLESPEGVLLKAAMDEADAGKKVGLLEEFAAKHPSHESATWVWGEVQTAYLAANEFDKAIAAGEKVLAGDPDDIAAANANLKAAEGKKDPALIQKWAVTTSDAARRLMKSADAAEAKYAKGVDAYCDYALYSLAMAATAPAARAGIGELLVKRSPESQYAAPLRPVLFVAHQQAGNHARAVEIADEEFRAGRANDDMLVFAASKAYEQKDKAKVTAYAGKLLEILPAQAAPQGVAEADWTKNKNLKLGLAYWMLGVQASGEQKWAEADKQLRAALPLVKDNKDLAAETLFHLGLANYKLGEPKTDKTRILDALRFNQQCAAIPSNFQAQAKKNVAAIRSQYRIQ